MSAADRPAGFSLIEVMVALILTVVAMNALLGCLCLILRCHRLCDQEWERTLELWNRSQELRTDPRLEESTWFSPSEGCRALKRFEMGPEANWEVFVDE